MVVNGQVEDVTEYGEEQQGDQAHQKGWALYPNG